MKRTDKTIIIFYIILAVSFVGVIIYIDQTSFANVKFLKQEKPTIQEITFVETVDVNKTKIFDTLADVENYPLVLPNNFLSVHILNKTGNVILAEEEVMEQYLKSKLLVKHTLVPYEKQTLEVMDGDAKGTIITETFEQINSTTKLTTDIKLHVTGKLIPIVYFPVISVQQELDKKILVFANYAKGFDSKYEKIVDSLYREILYRPADPQGLRYYATMLQNGKMTQDDIRNALSNSDEAKLVLKPSQMKTPDELDPTTKKTVNDLYTTILGRPADPQGLSYYGSLLENGKMTQDDIRNALSNSDEAAAMRIHTLSDRKLDILYEEIFHVHVDQKTLDHYSPLLESGNMTLDDVRKDLLHQHG